MALSGFGVTDGANVLADNGIKIIDGIREQEAPDIGDRTGEVAGIVVLPAGVLFLLNHLRIVVNNRGGDVIEDESAIHLLEIRDLGRSMRHGKTARVLHHIIGSFHAPPAMVKMHKTGLGDLILSEIGNEEFHDRV